MTKPFNFPVFDGHNDTLTNLYLPDRGGGRSFFEASDQCHLDLPRAKAGGVGGGFFAVFIPPSLVTGKINPPGPDSYASGHYFQSIDPTLSQQFALAVTASLFRLEREGAGTIKVVRTVAELATCLTTDVFAMILHFEGAEMIDPNLDALYVFYEAGLRSLSITWSRTNIFGHGVPFQCPASPDNGPGLTEAGKKLVKTCNTLGIMLDVAHLNEKGFWDVAKLTTAPLVSTHSAAHTLCPAARNLTDKQLDAIAESDGVVGVIFYTGNLRHDGVSTPDTPLSEIVRHIDYIVDRIGIDHVAFGSDFDGAVVPQAIHDVRGYPTLITALRQAGYNEDALEKLAYKNWLRVLGATWKVS